MTRYLRYHGKIRYVHDRDGETGREHFTVTVSPTRERTIRAICEMDDISLLRDVTLTVGPGFEPRECYNRLCRDGEFIGSSWFFFDGADIECQSLFADDGRTEQRVTLSQPTPVFACHPLYVDGYHAAAFDHSRPERRQLLEDCTNSSMMLDGSTKPMIGVVRKAVEYVGREPISVPAGTFVADHYRIWPLRVAERHWNDTPLDFWVHGPELLFLKLRWDMIESSYELVELDAPPEVAQRLLSDTAVA